MNDAKRNKINFNNLKDLWELRNLTVQDFLNALSKNSDLKFLVTIAGLWWAMNTIFVFVVGANVIYYVSRIFKLVLG